MPLASSTTGFWRVIRGVEYCQTQTAEGGDLFLTRFGVPFAEQLQPDHWLAAPWFEAHRLRLRGTSTIYRTQSKPARGRSLDLVVRFNRVGEDLPVDIMTRDFYTQAAFNSPFEEVEALMALRAARLGPKRRRILTQRPLAIYSPPQRLQPWQTGRSESQMAVKQARMPEMLLDLLRAYVLVYGWIKGADTQEVADRLGLNGAARERFLQGAMSEAEGELKQAGFRVLDMKAAHVIVRFTHEGHLLRRKDGRLAYALIDYELLERHDRQFVR